MLYLEHGDQGPAERVKVIAHTHTVLDHLATEDGHSRQSNDEQEEKQKNREVSNIRQRRGDSAHQVHHRPPVLQQLDQTKKAQSTQGRQRATAASIIATTTVTTMTTTACVETKYLDQGGYHNQAIKQMRARGEVEKRADSEQSEHHFHAKEDGENQIAQIQRLLVKRVQKLRCELE